MYQKFYLVVLEKYNKQIPDVIKDYVVSLNIIFEVICFNDLPKYLGKDNSIFILIQLKLPTDFFLSESDGNKKIINSKQIIFLNVEMLTETNRMQRTLEIFKYTNFIYAEYSAENIKTIETYTKNNNIHYTNKIIHLPYQFNIRENLVLQNLDNKYDYDVGIINAYSKPNPTVSPEFIYKRNLFWNKIQKEKDLKVVNIMGWENERDMIIKRCKIIINIHQFDCYNIHESIRCDRLIFSKKIIVSEPSIFMDCVDTKGYIFYEKFENIIKKVREILNNFETHNQKLQYTDLFPIIKERKKILFRSLLNI